MLRTDINGKLVDNEYADMAQLAEQLICNQQVIGSSPIIGCYSDPASSRVIVFRTLSSVG